MNGVGGGVIKKMHRGLGIGTIQPDGGGPEVVFGESAVKGGANGFDNLTEGGRVKYRPYPETIGNSSFAEDVWPD